MTKPIERDPIYRKRVFDAEIIILCVRWYICYRLTYRDLVEMMAERGIAIAHTTILRWVLRYIPEFEKRWDRFRRRVVARRRDLRVHTGTLALPVSGGRPVWQDHRFSAAA